MHPLLLCTGYFGYFLEFPSRQDWGITPTNQFLFDGTSMHWCGTGGMVRGVHVDGNGFNCQTFDAATIRLVGTPLGQPFLDRGSNPTVRQGMHACPVGSILVGAHFATNTFLCAPLGFCAAESNAGCPSGKTCRARTPHSQIGSCEYGVYEFSNVPFADQASSRGRHPAALLFQQKNRGRTRIRINPVSC